jgi:hypothetical protein
MKTKLNRAALLLLLLGLCVSPIRAAVEQFSAKEWQQKLREDWLKDAEIRSATQSVSTEIDAAGGCDGVKNGQYGFHTAMQRRPWWQVDLGKSQRINRVLIWNRCEASERASHLVLLLSDDGIRWRTAYQHNGSVFYGFSDNKPLEIKLTNETTRFVRVQLPGAKYKKFDRDEYLHLDEVEVFGPDHPQKNLALHQPATQSSISQWSCVTSKREVNWATQTTQVLKGCQWLVEKLADQRINVTDEKSALKALRQRVSAGRPEEIKSDLYLEARALERKLALKNPALDFDDVLFTKRAPGSFSHMSDQYYGWWSRPGGGVYIAKNFKSESPQIVCLTPQMPVGSFLRPELSYDGKKVLFAYCRYYPEVAHNKNKVDKMSLPEDSFYHLFQMNLDGSALRKLTHGHYDDFDGRYLPNGEIVFLSTRRGQLIQANKNCATRTLDHDALPDSFVRCGGDNYRPVSVYTLHVMDAKGENLRAISPFENFEWTPSIANDGRIMYSRWDYVDRDNMPFMSLWTTTPDGTSPQLVYGNFTRDLFAVLEARAVPHSRKMVFTASAHHSIGAGSLVLFDPLKGQEGTQPLQRLTPEVCFPEVEGWPDTWYAGAYPLSEDFYLTGWSNIPLGRQGAINPVNGMGVYLYDAAGNRELIYRDAEISSMDPIPVRPRATPLHVASNVQWDGQQDGTFLLLNVYNGLENVKIEIKNLRVVAVPSKTQPQRNAPVIGMTTDDPGKCVLGTVPVEADGSAYFRVPSGVNVFFQALDAQGMAVQTMRTVTYVQPNQTLSCVGCHESRQSVPQNSHPLAAMRGPSKLVPGPEGSWPLRFDQLVQPVLDRNCASCHNTRNENKIAARFDLTPENSYAKLVSFGTPSLKDYISKRYFEGKSTAAEGTAKSSALFAYLNTDAQHKTIKLNADDLSRLVTWMDCYAQRFGSFSDEQENELKQFKHTMAYLLEQK